MIHRSGRLDMALLLEVEVDKGGGWKVTARTDEAEEALSALVGLPCIAPAGVRRIEVPTASQTGPRRP